MATSSITKNFVISGNKQVKMFIDAIESSSNESKENHKISYKTIESEEELKEFMIDWNKNNKK